MLALTALLAPAALVAWPAVASERPSPLRAPQETQDVRPATEVAAAARAEWCAHAIGGWLELPEDPYGRVFAAIGPETASVAPPAEALAALAPGAGEAPETWRLWARTIARIAQGPADSTASRRPGDATTLALIATGQRRAEDAWRWLARHGPGAPEHVAGALAYLVPGVPADTPIGAGGRPGPLADGARLAPLAPPRPAGLAGWQVAWRDATFKGLTLGGAVLDGRIVVEPSGSELRLTHVSGERVTVIAALAEEVGFEFGGRYLDWEAAPPDAPADATIAVAPGDDEHVVWGRFVERREQRPAVPPPGLRPAQLALGGLALAVDRDDPRRPLVVTIAAELAPLLGARVVVTARGKAPGAPATDGGDAQDFAPIVIDVPPGPAGARTLAALATAIETHLVP